MKSKPIDIALRKNKGARILPGWISSFCQITGASITNADFLFLEETDILRNIFAQNVKKAGALHIYWPINTSYPEIERTICHLAEQRERIVLFHKADSQIGALFLSVNDILKNTDNLRELLGGDISFITKDGTNGLCLERTFYDGKGGYIADGIWELTAWGLFAQVVSDVKGPKLIQ